MLMERKTLTLLLLIFIIVSVDESVDKSKISFLSINKNLKLYQLEKFHL